MNFPLYDHSLAGGLLSGVLFGFALEAAGFGSARKLAAQFSLRDFAVIKVMFTAVIVAAVGLYLLRIGGVIGANAIYIPTLYFWAMLAGGLLIGGGMAIGGYCPGTSLVGFASGRIDAVAFAVGMVAGVIVFAQFFAPITDFYFAAKGPDAQRLTDLTGLPEWLILTIFVILAGLVFAFGARVEKARGGALTAEEACDTSGGAEEGRLNSTTVNA